MLVVVVVGQRWVEMFEWVLMGVMRMFAVSKW
jgi:hypothetical protein